MTALALEAVRVAVVVVFVLLTVKSLRISRRCGEPAARWLTASFAVLVAVNLAGVVAPGLAARQGSGAWKLTVCVLVLFPYLLGRFTAAFGSGSPSRRRRWLFAGVTASMMLATLALPEVAGTPHRTGPYTVFAVAFMAGWTVLSGLAARSLWRAGRDRPTVVRRRMRTLCLGSVMVNAAILLVGSAPPARPAVQFGVQFLGMVSAGLFFVGFAPPAALRAFWRQPDLDLYHASEGRLVAAGDAEAVARVVVPQAVALLGAGTCCMTDRDGRVLACYGLSPHEAVDLVAEVAGIPPGRGAGDPGSGRLALPLRGGWLVVAAGVATPAFGWEEVRLFQALAQSAEMALERVDLLERDRRSRFALVDRERQLAQAQRLARLGSWEWWLSAGRVVWSEEMYRLYELDPGALDGDADYRWFRLRSHPDDAPAMEEAVRAALVSGQPFHLDHRLMLPDGRVRWLHSRGQVVLGEAGTPVCLQGTAQEITAVKMAEEQLRRQAHQQAAVAQLGERALAGLDIDVLFEEAADLVARALDADPDGVAELLHRSAPTADDAAAGLLDWQALASRGLQAPDVDFLSSVGNVLAAAAHRHRVAEEIVHQALHDPLTGLPNRALLMDRLGQASARARRQPAPLAVLFLDLDRFKVVNDGLGHSAGDELLRVVARRLADAVRPGDTVARFGGDEFVILCENLPGEDDAAALAGRIADMLSDPVQIAGRKVAITASIGIVVGDAGLTSPEELLRDADTAMYQAKEGGRARSAVFDAPARRRVLERLDREVALHGALERGEFRLWFQPEIALADGRLVGLEALLRWEHPEWGLQLPGQFLDLAHETGLIMPIGRWALEEACRQAQAVRSARPELASLVVWVNISARQLLQPDLAGEIGQVLADTDTGAGLLGLEITESVFMEDVESLDATLSALRHLGVRLAIDDFGIGFSSLRWLRRFPVDVLKVDRSFVEGVTGGDGDRAIVDAIVGLARSLGIIAVAEGVESRAQVAALRSLGCHVAQGFYFSPPMDPVALLGAVSRGGTTLPWGDGRLTEGLGGWDPASSRDSVTASPSGVASPR